MNMSKRFCALFVCLLVLLAVPVTVFAEPIDTTKEAKLTVCFEDNGTGIADVEFNIYRVADVSIDGIFTLSGDFSSYPVSVICETESDWKATAGALSGYVYRDKLQPVESGVTDKEGTVVFDSLTSGLYLVMDTKQSYNNFDYTTEAFMVALPIDGENNSHIYEVTVNPKFTKEELPQLGDYKVIKVWEDEGNKKNRPEEITVNLLRDKKVYDTVTLNKENNWKYTWKDLDESYKWNVAEECPEGYTVAVEKQGNTFVLTNTGIPAEPEPELPQTGMLWWPVIATAALGLVFLVIGLVFRKGKENE